MSMAFSNTARARGSWRSQTYRIARYFVAQRDNPALGLYVSEPLTTRREGRNAIALSRRIIDEAGRFAGVVSGFIDLAALQRFFHDVNLGAHSSIALLREGEGHPTMVVREPDLPDVMGKRISNATYREALGSAALVTSSIDGEKRFVAGARVDGFPLVVAVTRKAAAGPIRGAKKPCAWRSVR